MPSVRELGVVLAAVVALQLDVWLLEPHAGPRVGTAVAALVLGLLLLLRRAPLVLTGATTTLIVGQSAAGARLTSMLTSAIVAMVITASISLRLPRRPALWAAAVLLMGTWADLLLQRQDAYSVASDLVFTAVVVVGLPGIAGQALRRYRERVVELEQLTQELAEEREERERLAVLDERHRIAREMHDVVAHSVSLMVVQAGGARSMLDSDLDDSRQALLAVETVGREALAELRRVLDLLHGTSEPLGLRPQPGTAELAGLVAATRGAGLEADLVVVGERRPLPAGVELAVYRMVQEALTNAVKHARASRAAVQLTWQPGALEIAVVDDGCGPLVPAQGGHGLAGMRDRLAAYGGDLQAGPRDGGGFAVRARIPLAPVTA